MQLMRVTNGCFVIVYPIDIRKIMKRSIKKIVEVYQGKSKYDISV